MMEKKNKNCANIYLHFPKNFRYTRDKMKAKKDDNNMKCTNACSVSAYTLYNVQYTAYVYNEDGKE